MSEHNTGISQHTHTTLEYYNTASELQKHQWNFKTHIKYLHSNVTQHWNFTTQFLEFYNTVS